MSSRFSRRNLIKSAAIVSGAAATSGTTLCATAMAAPEKKTKEPLRVGIMTYTLGAAWDIETLIKNCTEAKFEHAQLRTTHAHGVEVTLNKQQRADVKKRFEDSALSAISLASAFSYHHDDPKVLRENIEGTKAYTLLARDVGAGGFRVFPNSLMLHKGIPEEKTLQQIGKSLREVGDFAADYGIQIRIACHGKQTTSVARVRKMLDFADTKNVYVNWNCNQSDLDDPGFEANFASVGSRIANVHMHGLFNEKYPYRRLFELLQKVDYKGYCDAEIPASKEPVRLMKYYRALFRAYQNVI